jgi:hypothetical protein
VREPQQRGGAGLIVGGEVEIARAFWAILTESKLHSESMVKYMRGYMNRKHSNNKHNTVARIRG